MEEIKQILFLALAAVILIYLAIVISFPEDKTIHIVDERINVPEKVVTMSMQQIGDTSSTIPKIENLSTIHDSVFNLPDTIVVGEHIYKRIK